MVFSLQQIQSCTVGALRVWKEDDHFRFARMSEALEEAFYGVRPAFRDRAQSTTDIRLDFHTDSRMIRLDVDQSEPGTACKVELYVDGLPALFEAYEGRKVIVHELPEGMKRVTIVLPCHQVGRLYNLSVDEWARVEPHRFEKKILFLGDSITQGWKADHDSMSYSNLVARWFDAESLNWAVGGSCFDPAFVEKTDFDPDVVIVGYGTNDYSARKDMALFTDYCRGHLDKVKEHYGSKKVFVISPIWRADHQLCKGTGALNDCRAVVAREAEARGFTHIDGFKLVPHDREYMADGYLHPNDLGFYQYAMNLIKELTPYI